MMTITIDKHKFELPESWEEVTLGQFCKLNDLKKDKYSTLEKDIKVLGILSNTNKDDIWKKLQRKEFEQIQNEFTWLDKMPQPTHKNDWVIDGKHYGIKKDLQTLNVGEEISVEMLLQDTKSDLQPVEIAFGMLFREKNEDGSLKDFNVDEMFNIIKYMKDNVMVCDVVGATAFFLGGETTSIKKNSKPSFQIQKTSKTNTPSKKKAKKK